LFFNLPTFLLASHHWLIWKQTGFPFF